MATIKLEDGYNGSEAEFDSKILERIGYTYKVAIAGKPWLTRWVHASDYEKARRIFKEAVENKEWGNA